MIDSDLKIQLDSISQNLVEINKKSGKGGIWRSFFNGMFGALGYVAGLVIVVVVLFWVLQKTGQLAAFQGEIRNFTDLVDSAKKLISNDSQASTVNQNSGGEQTTVTLPNGQQIQVQIPQK